MGIQNLLPFVKNACRQGNMSEFSGCSVAIDVSCLLHRGLFGCTESVAQGKKTNFYIYYVEKHVKALLALGCHVIMVLDGRSLPAKKNTNDERRQRRADNIRAGELLLSEGKLDEALVKFKRATEITSDVVESTIQHFRDFENLDIIVSPYESDAQLAFLVNEGLADVVVTEDSDLIVFGCEKIAFKWNSSTGECVVYEKSHLPRCFTGVMKSHFDFTKFRRICILSGCDYLQAGLPGIGLNKALSFFSKTSRTDLRKLLPRIPGYLNMSKLNVSKEFVEEFIRAENTFLYQVVFDPRQRCQRPLTPYPCPKRTARVDGDDDDFAKRAEDIETDFSYAGEVQSSTLAVRLALGNQADQSVLSDKFFLPSTVPSWSVWCDRYESCGQRKRRFERTRQEEERKCGSAFQFDSPSTKRAKSEAAERIPCIDLDTENDTTATSCSSEEQRAGSQSKENFEQLDIDRKPATRASSPLAVQRAAIAECGNRRGLMSTQNVRSRVVKNEAGVSWNVDELMKTYGSQSKSENTNSVPPLSYHSEKSAYFMGRTGSCSNPFRKPVIKPSKTTSNSSTNSTKLPAGASLCDQREKEGDDVRLFSLISAVGCRPSGLRCSFKN